MIQVIGRVPNSVFRTSVLFAVLIILTTAGISFAQAPNGNLPAPTNVDNANAIPDPTIWELARDGGIFMIPICICSLVVVTFSIERLIGLRRNKILPPALMEELNFITGQQQSLDPRDAYKLCQQYQSPLATAVRAAILKAGRPHTEVEKAVEDAVAREAATMSKNIRPINVCASIAPMLGLLGTVQGMIMAFMVTSATTGAEKAQELAHGIYTALVTTFAGLCVAVCAVVLSNFLEGKIDNLLRQMEEIFLELLHRFERFEGKMRVSRTLQPLGSEEPQKTASESAVARDKRVPATKAVASKELDRPESQLKTKEQPAEEAAEASPTDETEKNGPKGLWSVMGSPDTAEEVEPVSTTKE